MDSRFPARGADRLMTSRWRHALLGVGAAATVVLAAACNSLVSQFSLTCASVDVSYLVAVGLDVIDPPTLTVQQGDIVCWEAVDGATHPLISSNGTTLNGTADQFEPYVDTLTALGTFAYHCVAHEADGETATITVEPADPEE